MGEMLRELERGPVYTVAVDPRFRAAQQAIFAPSGRAANVHTIILGEDDVDAIPEGAPIYLMHSARRRLGDAPLARRVTPVRRIFATEMARDILTFVVRSNIAATSARSA